MPIEPCDFCINAVEARLGPVPDQEDSTLGERYRLWQAEHLLHLFRDVHGRDAMSMEELNDWGRIAKRSREQEPH